MILGESSQSGVADEKIGYKQSSRCVVRGEGIFRPGGIEQVRRGRYFPGTYKRADGVFTDAGPVCGVCLPAYERALDEAHDGISTDCGSPGRIRSYVRGKLADEVFVAESLRENARKRIDYILGGLGYFDFTEAEATVLRDFMIKGIDVAGESYSGDEGGLGVYGAMACFRDETRTRKFLRALFGGLAELESRSEKIEVVDAGCGPIPLFGALAALKFGKVSATCIEINESSARIAESVVYNLGLSDRVKVVVGDAMKYTHNKPIDLLVSETMNSGLTEEPLLQIMQNLSPQVAQDGVVIPEWVSVDAGLVDLRGSDAYSNIFPDSAYIAPPVEVVRIGMRGQISDVVDFLLPIPRYKMLAHLAISSRVGLGCGGVLECRESVITNPIVVCRNLHLDSGRKNVCVSYVAGAKRAAINAVVK